MNNVWLIHEQCTIIHEQCMIDSSTMYNNSWIMCD